MARAAVLGRLTWRVGTVAAIRDETATARTIVLDVPGWPGHLAGQHVDVRLTAAGRVLDPAVVLDRLRPAAAGRPAVVELTVQRLEDGEVSPYLTQTPGRRLPAGTARPGRRLVRLGPGRPGQHRPVLLVAGGSGVVPLMAMIRERAAAGSHAPFRLIYSVRDPGGPAVRR